LPFSVGFLRRALTLCVQKIHKAATDSGLPCWTMDSQLSPLAERVRSAAADQTPLRIRGGGSKQFLAGAAARGEWLDARSLAGIVSYEPSELVINARAGTPLAELEAALGEQNQCLPFEPPHFGTGATVGGMVAAGLSGPARASVGAVRDYMLGVSIINGRGEPLTFGGQVMKNVAGYDVSRLISGSWGTLGLITEVSLKVLPVAPAEATLAFEWTQAQALERLHAWGGLPLPLNASCWVEDQGAGRLYVRLRGAAAAVEAACRSMGGERQTSASVAGDWQDCREQRLPWFVQRAPQHALWRLSLPQTAPVLSLPPGTPPPLVEWHGALRWVQAESRHGATLQELARGVGGSASLFVAASAHTTRADGSFDPMSPALKSIHARLRQAFDPAGIFQSGRMGG
jgi:glycolate oxidase FAD binding subunit